MSTPGTSTRGSAKDILVNLLSSHAHSPSVSPMDPSPGHYVHRSEYDKGDKRTQCRHEEAVVNVEVDNALRGEKCLINIRKYNICYRGELRERLEGGASIGRERLKVNLSR